MPLWPQGRAVNGEANSLASRRRTFFLVNESGSGCPCRLVSSGLGSNVSTCEGPPFMNRKISRLALGA